MNVFSQLFLTVREKLTVSTDHQTFKPKFRVNIYCFVLIDTDQNEILHITKDLNKKTVCHDRISNQMLK